MTRTIAERLAGDDGGGGGVILLDGATGTQLIARGLELGQCPELWNLARPDDVRAVHAGYAAAGSDVVHANTFGANPFVLEKHGLADRLEELCAAGVRLARDAAGPGRLVAGDVGPSGLMLPPVGGADPAALEAGYARQAAALAASGVDYLAIETMVDLAEALCAVRGCRRGAPGLSVTACMTFDRKKRGFFTLMGQRPDQCARALALEGAIAVGANCSVGSAAMVELCALLVEGAPGVPVVAKPNAGLPEMVGGHAVYRQAPDDFARDVAEMVSRGARAVGGCCGTDERFVAAIAAALGRQVG
jgi:5-methyltetrahydrofolate--homocysteine methyltransferase